MQHSKILYSKGLIKQKNMVTQSQLAQVQFHAKLDNIKTFYTSLKAINFNDDANIILSDDGFRAVVEESKYVQASMYVTRGCFSEFHLADNAEIQIRVNLTVVTDCLSVFASPECSMKIIYKGNGAPLVLVLEQHDGDDLITEVSVKTKSEEEHMDFGVDEEDENYNVLVMRGPDFYNLINDINKSADVVEILLSPQSPNFRLNTFGVMQLAVNVEIAKSSELFISFGCQTKSSAKYKLSHIRLIMKALALASKVSMRNDGTGLLALQMMVSERETKMFIEFFVTPLVDEVV